MIKDITSHNMLSASDVFEEVIKYVEFCGALYLRADDGVTSKHHASFIQIWKSIRTAFRGGDAIDLKDWYWRIFGGVVVYFLQGRILRD